jgi:hypothetical protein
LFWTARHYTILCFRHNLSRQIPANHSVRRNDGLQTAFIRRRSGVDPARYSTLFTDVRQPFSRQSRARPEMHFKHPEKARAAIQKADTLPLRP